MLRFLYRKLPSFYRRFVQWNRKRRYLNWLKYADKNKLWLNLTQEHIAQYLPDSLSAHMVETKHGKTTN